MAKKFEWYKDSSTIIASISLLGVLCGGIVVAASYINLPKVTEAIAAEQKETAKRIDAIERYIDINQAILENNQKQQQFQQQQYQNSQNPQYPQQTGKYWGTTLPYETKDYQQLPFPPQPYCVPEENGILWCWDERTQSWYKAQP